MVPWNFARIFADFRAKVGVGILAKIGRLTSRFRRQAIVKISFCEPKMQIATGKTRKPRNGNKIQREQVGDRDEQTKKTKLKSQRETTRTKIIHRDENNQKQRDIATRGTIITGHRD